MQCQQLSFPSPVVSTFDELDEVLANLAHNEDLVAEKTVAH